MNIELDVLIALWSEIVAGALGGFSNQVFADLQRFGHSCGLIVDSLRSWTSMGDGRCRTDGKFREHFRRSSVALAAVQPITATQCSLVPCVPQLQLPARAVLSPHVVLETLQWLLFLAPLLSRRED